MSSRLSRTIGAAVFSIALATSADAQTVDRPQLPRGADTNDWEAYYDAGIAALAHDATLAEAHFVWSSRLRPDRAEPLYARWLAYWARNINRFGDYLRDDERVLRDPRVKLADSLRAASMRRNPFVHQGLVVFLYNQLPGRWQYDPLTLGWLSLGQADLPRALERFGQLVKTDPRKYGYLRFTRASAFANTGAFDSASAELTALLAQLRADDEKTLGRPYQSKELLEYALGQLHLAGRRTTQAKEAFGRAVVENAAFAPSHAMLGNVAIAARDSTTALLEHGLAVEMEPSDAERHIGHGNALMLAKRPTEASAAFKRAIALEPLYADGYYLLGQSLEAAGDTANAKAQFARFMEMSSLKDARRADARRRMH